MHTKNWCFTVIQQFQTSYITDVFNCSRNGIILRKLQPFKQQNGLWSDTKWSSKINSQLEKQPHHVSICTWQHVTLGWTTIDSRWRSQRRQTKGHSGWRWTGQSGDVRWWMRDQWWRWCRLSRWKRTAAWSTEFLTTWNHRDRVTMSHFYCHSKHYSPKLCTDVGLTDSVVKFLQKLCCITGKKKSVNAYTKLKQDASINRINNKYFINCGLKSAPGMALILKKSSNLLSGKKWFVAWY